MNYKNKRKTQTENIYGKLLPILKQRRGNPVSFKELETMLSRPAKESGNRKKKKPGKTPPRKNPALNEALGVLEEYSLIRFQKGKVIPVHPFAIEARLSVAKSGAAFAEGPYPDDIFIPAAAKAGAHNRDTVLVEITGKRRARLEGSVVRILKRFSDRYYAHVISTETDCLIELPDLPDTPSGVVQTKEKLKPGEFLIVRRTEQNKKTYMKSGRGRGGYRSVPVYKLDRVVSKQNVQTDLERIYLKYNAATSYPKELIPSRKALKQMTQREMKNPNRKDLTALHSITIDGKTSKDFDDAISIERTGGGYILYVHIADVSFYVAQNSPLDQEALTRGNSWYLANSVLPMLPPILSEDFCSLNPKTRRLALTCEMYITERGDIQSYQFYKSKIYLNKRYTYESAEADLQKKKSPLSTFWELSSILEKARNKRGRVSLEIPEIEAKWDKHGNLISMHKKERLQSHKLIEEFMLSANICAARFARDKKVEMLFRVHEKPDPKHLEKINLFLSLFGLRKRIRKLDARSIAEIVNEIDSPETLDIFQYLLLRTFSQARYDRENIGHWGLGFKDYAHFTSPIRRFADLTVHRQIEHSLAQKDPAYNAGDLEFIGLETSRVERMAMSAERDIRKLLTARYFQNRIGKSFDAWITGFHPEGLFIALSDSIAEGFIPAQSISSTGEIKHLDDLRVLSDRWGKTLVLGQKMKVELKSIDFAKIRMNFEILKI